MFVGLRKYHDVTISFLVFDSELRILGDLQGKKTKKNQKTKSV